jgi:hypothetical protein
MVGKSGTASIPNSPELLDFVGSQSACKLVVTLQIEREYERHCSDPHTASRQLRIKLGGEGRIIDRRCKSNLWNPVRIKLMEAGFTGQGDLEFVRAAMASDSKIIVANEPHFAQHRRLILRTAGVRVLTPTEALELFREQSGTDALADTDIDGASAGE